VTKDSDAFLLARRVLCILDVTTIFGGVAPLGQALDYHLERHNLLAANVAHVDTPRYKPVDLARTTATSHFGEIFQVALSRTDQVHMDVSSVEKSNGRVFTDASAGGGADGNFVSLDREAAKLTANQLRYDIVSVLVSSELSGLMKAAQDMKG
jgi:flagellar basal-body rod protein FlgB